eukprot:GHVR01011342.1.p1 GENE.GHVR01011342.1~~GHVR01011342.1.p1  ORF type:complete len:217 (+),score=33.92 GHVR01011342.1:90-740(+)
MIGNTGRHQYSSSDDCLLSKYACDHYGLEVYDSDYQVKGLTGNNLWIEAQQKNVIPGVSWQGMRQRVKNILAKNGWCFFRDLMNNQNEQSPSIRLSLSELTTDAENDHPPHNQRCDEAPDYSSGEMDGRRTSDDVNIDTNMCKGMAPNLTEAARHMADMVICGDSFFDLCWKQFTCDHLIHEEDKKSFLFQYYIPLCCKLNGNKSLVLSHIKNIKK